MGGHQSTHHLAPRRQHSQTHSKPDNSEVDAGSVHNSVTGRAPRSSFLLAMHEYTSITDELETVYGLFSPPHTPRTPITSSARLLSPARAASPSVRRRHASEMSNPEFALFMEKEHLRGAEEDDYIIMENLIQRRLELGSVLDRYEEEVGEAGEGEVSGISISVCVNTSGAEEHPPPQSSALLGLVDHCAGETNASSELSLSHMVSESLPPRPSIVLDSSQLPRQRSADAAQPHAPAPAPPETMC
ncbi:Transient receptor potential cation channel [Operophtera brumata]|uniref:Transient receptor potential cation channel n=1 Tax=Operophtera brumata TaxID=104452 RepID=A0A0L7LR34_OPEBR|nr:Transient receptor potential cation channel [Operophtera brumata]